MNYWLKVVKNLPPGLRQDVIKKLYRFKTGNSLKSIRFYQNSQNFVYETDNGYIPSGLLNMFATYKYYEEWVSRLSAWAYQPQPGDIIVDIGAGIGEEAIVFSKLVTSAGKIYSIEANPDVFKILSDIVSFNQLSNISLHNLAIANDTGVMQLHVSDTSYVDGSFQKTASSVHQYEIKAMRLDEFIKSNEINRIDLLKANIEGAERFVIGSIGAEINKVRQVAIACHDFRFKESGNDFFKTKQLVKEFLLDHHFELQFQQSSVEDFNDWVYGVNKHISV